ncbi:MAG TPA: hypothetical protein VN667_20055 [Burkholderiales bacterium]|nr:hypothetical protein [Burkholderiales bacterium]
MTDQIGRARLDGDGVYLGLDVIDPAELQEGDVEVPADCDLAAGKYRWDGKTFLPIMSQFAGASPPAAAPVSAEVALAGLIAALKQAKTPLPAATERWYAAFKNTIDGAGQ